MSPPSEYPAQKPDRPQQQHAPCGFCGSRNSQPLYSTYSITGGTFYLRRCLNCRAVFLSPRPTDRQLSRAYDDSYYGAGQDKFSAPVEKILDFFRAGRARKLAKYVNPPARVLDIGCGNGKFLGFLIRRGYSAYGTELPGKAAQRAEQIPGLHLKTGPLQPGDFSADFFDAVCMWHVLEHLTDPGQTLEIIKTVLKPYGYLFISLPNIESLQSRFFRGHWLHLDPPKHLFLLGPDELARQMHQLGFRLCHINYFSLEQNPFGIQQSLLNRLLDKREVLFEALKGNKSYAKQYPPGAIALQKLFYLSTFPVFAALAAIESALKKGGTMTLVFRNSG